MLMVIFGAGASYDSVSTYPPNVVGHPHGGDVANRFHRPPLANELFENRPLFADIIERFQACEPIIPRLRAVQGETERWKASTLSERAAAQSHFIDLCEVLGQPHPAAADQTGDTFTFEKHVSTLEDGKGFADVWKRGFFGWEYKGKHKSLNAAYAQLVRYQGDLENRTRPYW